MSDSGGFIYFIANDDFSAFKIGYAKYLSERLRNLQTGNHVELHFEGFWPGNKQDEAILHARFRHLHIAREWFRLNEEAFDFLEGVEDYVRETFAQRYFDPQLHQTPEDIVLALDEVPISGYLRGMP